MPDIVQQDAVATVQRRLEGQGQGGGRDAPRGQPPKKVAASYQEVARAKPVDDRITILGIPVEQITPVTQAALAGLVAEINHLRNIVKRHDRGGDKRGGAQNEAAILEPEAFLRSLGATLSQPPGEGTSWMLVLIHVATYEDIRRSMGLLAANSALADVAHRLKDLRLSTSAGLTQGDNPTVSFVLLGYAGGSNIAAVAALPHDDLDSAAVIKSVRDHLLGSGYVVGGIDMALALSVAAAAVGSGESALLALGRADHLLRTGV
jgi:hypothetical protein